MIKAPTPIAHQIIIPDFVDSLFNEKSRMFLDKALIKLLTGTHGSDFEKLLPSKMYSMRLEGKGRLLLAKGVIERIPTLVLVECLLNHEYEQSKCITQLTSSQLTQHIERCAQGAVYVVNAEHSGLIPCKSEKTTHQLVEYGEHFIAATKEQQKVLGTTYEEQTPVLFGEAGSGKTLVLMQRMVTLARILATDEHATRRIWVIVPHVPLQRHIQQEWENHSVYREIEHNKRFNPVHIVTPDALYRHLDGIPQEIQSRDYHDFLHWLSKEAFERIQAIARVSRLQVYQELCILNGLKILHPTEDAAALYARPEFGSVLLESEDKHRTAQELLALQQQYQAHLVAHQGFDPYLYQPRTSLPEEDYLFIDEAQNVPPGVLPSAAALIAMNDSQSICFKRRVNEIFLTLIGKGKITYQTLSGSHRCPKFPITLAERVDSLVTHYISPKRKQARTSNPLTSCNATNGFVCFSEGTTKDIHFLKQIVLEPDTAVVYLTDASKQAFDALGITPLCAFTKDNPILGLEFKRIIVAFPFDSTHARLNSLIRQEKTGTSAPSFHANESSELELYFNKFKAALTRATETVIIVQTPTHDAHALLDFFKETPHVVWAPLQTIDMEEEERRTLLYQQACDLYRQGHVEMSLDIIAYLGQDGEEFKLKMNPDPAIRTPLQPIITPQPALESKTKSPSNIKAATQPSDQALSQQSSSSNIKANHHSLNKTNTPLSQNLSDYVEKFLNKVSKDNVKPLLLHKHAATMLFHHQMNNGCCLFLNLCFNEKLYILQQTIENKECREALMAAIATISNEDYFVQLVLRMELHVDHPKLLTVAKLRQKGLDVLFNDSSLLVQYQKAVHLYRMHHKKLIEIKPKEIIRQYCSKEGILSPLFLHVLASDSARWTKFFSTQKNAFIKEALTAAFTQQSTGAKTQLNPIFACLMDTDEGRKWVHQKMNIIAPLLTTEALFTPQNGNSTSPFYWLCVTFEGRELLKKHWMDFKQNLCSEGLFAQVTAEGPDKDKSPFYLLCETPEGRTLLTEHWEDFKPHLNSEGLFAQITGEGPDKGKSPFYWLCATPEGQTLLTKHWEDFKLHLRSKGLFAQVTAEGLFKGQSPFYFLCVTPEGQTLLTEHWDNFKLHLSSEGLFAQVTGEGPFKGISPFYLLCATPEGQTLLTKHWGDFKLHLRSKGLFAQVTAERPFKGQSPFYSLCVTFEGRELLKKHWMDFK
ncbi:MAG: hypothetical protein QM652_12875, partial [Legionella sp.]|uniref:hypothetical protein n=1 Tax=Legionella sp. TaxID=459 RepID=UPI0039E6FDD4